MEEIHTLWHFIGKHKYVITIAVFAVIMLFFDDNCAITRIKSAREIYRLKSQIEMYRAQYDESTRRLNELEDNPEAIEKVAREKYLMKRSNEDIYVFED